MNLYQLDFSHHAQKGSKFGIFGYLLASSDEEVYEYYLTEPKSTMGETAITCWKDSVNDGPYSLYDGQTGDSHIDDATHKEAILHYCGDYDIDTNEDYYYGVTRYGWSLLKENVNLDDYKSMIELNIVKIWK